MYNYNVKTEADKDSTTVKSIWQFDEILTTDKYNDNNEITFRANSVNHLMMPGIWDSPSRLNTFL